MCVYVSVRLRAFLAADDMASKMVVWYTLTSGIAIAAALFIAWFIPSATGQRREGRGERERERGGGSERERGRRREG